MHGSHPGTNRQCTKCKPRHMLHVTCHEHNFVILCHVSLKQKLNSQLYAFSSLSLPFSNSLLLWCSVNHLVWGSKSSSPNNNDGLLIRNQIQPPWLRVKLAWLLRGQIRKIFGVRHKNTVMLYAELQTDNLISDQFTFYPSIGLRYQ